MADPTGQLRILGPDDVRRALPMATAIAAMRGAMAAHAAGAVDQPLRLHLAPAGFGGTTLVKPAAVRADQPALGLKVVSIADGNRARGLPTITGFVALLDPGTGVPLAIMDGAAVTAVRTAAASAVATDALAGPDAGDLAILGTGVQARSHLLAMAEVRRLRRVRVWGRTPERATELVAWAASRGVSVQAVASAEEAVVGADLVCTTTSSTEPVLQGEWLADGCHVNAVGGFRPADRELSASAVARADVVVVDSVEAAAEEAGDLLLAVADGVALPDDPLPSLGEVLLGTAPGRTGSAQVTLYESLGMAVQDVAAAAAALAAADAAGLGTVVPW